MDRVKWNDFMEILSDDLDRSGEYLINGFSNMVSDFITNADATVGLSVTAQAVPDMSVYVKAGRLYQQGRQGTLEADSSKLTIAAAHNSYARIDRIVAQYQEVEDLPETRNVMTDVVSRNIVQQTVKTRIAGTVVFQVLQGVPAAVPVPVTVPDGWISLAKVNVPANVAQIQQSNIVDDAPKLLGFFNHNHNGAGGGQKISYKNLTDTPAIATQAEVEAGTDNTKMMTPSGTLSSIKKHAIDLSTEQTILPKKIFRQLYLKNTDSECEGGELSFIYSRDVTKRVGMDLFHAIGEIPALRFIDYNVHTNSLHVVPFYFYLDGSIKSLKGDVDFVKKKYIDSSKWYREYSSGWLEQGGSYEVTVATGFGHLFTLPRPFANTNYNIIASFEYGNDVPNGIASVYVNKKSNTQVSFVLDRTGSLSGQVKISWMARGQVK